MTVTLRAGTRFDIDALLALESECFSTDRLSRRSFMRFVSKGAHNLLVAIEDNKMLGYVLVLFRSGTSLARIYSIAVSPAARGKGVASELLTKAEAIASQRYCLFIRLEVHTQNTAALELYKKFGYKPFTRIKQYYEDGGDAEQLEKRLLPIPPATAPAPYYQQTTEFTCGPASLMMGLQALNKDYIPSTQDELQIWREATTIFMTAGHGGCSPHGLALSAHWRGYKPVLYINTDETPFLDSVRGEQKKRVLTQVHETFLEQISKAGIDVRQQSLNAQEIQDILSLKLPVVALISTWMLNRNKAPHWVFVSNANEDFVYINDPDPPDAPWQTADYRRAPIQVENFVRMAAFGRRKLRAFLVLDKQENA
ncbi:GNAT family N-acetyltransferase/peptidase C39 family protein [Litorivivens sp.]|uniref:GNAT family N-acetyltransferase/peptidase C39 family protein n=1 Tax=Litorivivens sp. TaxID=2020868 RepID=UPI00356783C0